MKEIDVRLANKKTELAFEVDAGQVFAGRMKEGWWKSGEGWISWDFSPH